MTAPVAGTRRVFPTYEQARAAAAELERAEGVATGVMHTSAGWVLRYDPYGGAR